MHVDICNVFLFFVVFFPFAFLGVYTRYLKHFVLFANAITFFSPCFRYILHPEPLATRRSLCVELLQNGIAVEEVDVTCIPASWREGSNLNGKEENFTSKHEKIAGFCWV